MRELSEEVDEKPVYCKLYDLPQRTEKGVLIHVTPELTVIFDHLDGMYSYCTVAEGKSKGQPFHLSVGTPLKQVVKNREYEVVW